jgi:hypothetical protein
LLFCLIGYVAVWATGLGGFPNGKTVDSLKAALGQLSTSHFSVTCSDLETNIITC